MNAIMTGPAITFGELAWDTDFFGVTCAKAILYKPASRAEWNDLKEKFDDYEFVSIENRNSDPSNASYIGQETSAFLCDVNIQFIKKLRTESATKFSKAITIGNNLEPDERILGIGEFPFSKFVTDPELAKRNGQDVYNQWLMNSFGRPDKYFAVFRLNDGTPAGFLLHSYSHRACTVELIAVASTFTTGGIGSTLINAVESAAIHHGCTELRVGTQMRNLGAINFYQKCGFRQVGCHQAYHLWNL